MLIEFWNTIGYHVKRTTFLLLKICSLRWEISAGKYEVEVQTQISRVSTLFFKDKNHKVEYQTPFLNNLFDILT